MSDLGEIQNKVADILSLIKILKQACENNYDIPFAADTQIMLDVIEEKQKAVLELLDKQIVLEF